MIGLLRTSAVLMAMALVIDCSDRGGAERIAEGNASVATGASAPSARTVAEQANGFARTDGGAFVGFHLGPQFSSTIDDNGAQLAGLDRTWTMGLHVARIGRVGAMREVGRAAPSATRERVDIARGGGVTEWFAHRDRGLEHGIDVSVPPAGAGELVIEVAVEGRTAVAVGDGQQVELRDAGSGMTLSYGELSVKDAVGRDIAARMDVIGGMVTMAVHDEGARYPLVVDPIVWKQKAKLVAADGEKDDQFGSSVALSGSTAIVGAWFKKVGSNSRQGAAYVFVRSGTTWTQQAKLVAADGAELDFFGISVALNGPTAIVGAYAKTVGSNGYQGAAYVFVQSGATWTQKAKLVAADGAYYDLFGTSVALSGSTAIVGAHYKTIGSNIGQGAAYIFVQSGTTWTQQAKLVAADGAANDAFGYSVALSGPTAIVGAYLKIVGSNVYRGAAYAFVQSGSTWTQQAMLVAADGAANDYFGYSVALSSSTAIVGAYGKNVGSNGYQGAAYLFVRSGTTWKEKDKLVASDGAAIDEFGSSVALSGSTAIVGAHGKSFNRGAAYVLVPRGTNWTEQAILVAADGGAGDHFGSSVALDGSTAIVGSYRESSGGAAYIFASPLHPNGDACTVGTDCASSLCVDAVCCDGACNAGCEACTAAKKGSGVDGTCGFVADGADPSRTCEPPTCAADTLTAHTCDGKGGCRVATSVCAPFTCDSAGKGCRKNCAENVECSAGFSCVGGVCVNGPWCSEDRRQSILGSGPAILCEPYLCSPATGLCAQSCDRDGDCATDNFCSASRTCGPLAKIRGCGCALPGATSHGDDLWPIAALGVLARRQYKRRRAPRGMIFPARAPF